MLGRSLSIYFEEIQHGFGFIFSYNLLIRDQIIQRNKQGNETENSKLHQEENDNCTHLI